MDFIKSKIVEGGMKMSPSTIDPIRFHQSSWTHVNGNRLSIKIDSNDLDNTTNGSQHDTQPPETLFDTKKFIHEKIVSGSEMTRTGQPYDNKSGQWLGSIVTSSGEDGTVLVIKIFEEITKKKIIPFKCHHQHST